MLSDLEAVAKRIICCYERASNTKVSIDAAHLAKGAFDKTSVFLARKNIMSMLRMLDAA